ncbi:uncharacterized protein [Linepithema humile]|uniref:uncharacterized protein isoform X2 n=1 Tax=Linepithema humile TaxID=83485 RepID=UPI0006230591|nr:PREDICTED: uncharacterized protein LOC105678538 isoform X2 [Linepithema humile]
MVKCIVSGCSITNSDKKSDIQKALEQNIKISLHRLPKNVNRRKLWLKNIGLHEDTNLKKTASVCSLHFKEEDINRTLDKIVLHENAVPYSEAFIYDMHKQENIENEQNCLNLSFSVDGNQLSNLETSSNDTHCAKKLNMGNQENNHQEENISMQVDKQTLLNECTGELILKEEYLLAVVNILF